MTNPRPPPRCRARGPRPTSGCATRPRVALTQVLPPCPPCGRCPQPAFTCKKVPDYSSDFFDDGRGNMNDESKYRPGALLIEESDGKRRAGGSVMPVLNDFSSF